MSHHQPSPTFAARQLARVLPIACSYSRPGAWGLTGAIAAATLAFQAVAPPSASVVLLYILLAAQSVWYLGGRFGSLVTGMTVLGGTLLAARHDPALGVALLVWNGAARLVSVGLIAFILTGLRSALEIEHWRSSTDQLTGALNRSAFEERLAPAMRSAVTGGQSLVLAYLDLDGFKAVNDDHGHAAGNRVLAAFASAAQGAIRASDLFARVGGDEFAALLRVPDPGEGERVAALLHRRLSAVLGVSGYPVTCSMGALVMPASRMADEAAAMEQADRLMYLAKQGGKNALCIGRDGTEAAGAGTRASLRGQGRPAETLLVQP